MAGAYYKPCKEFDICNELIEKYWESKQYDKCFEGHLVLAEQGYPLAECQIGYFYYEGLGVEKDLEKALYWTRRAAEHGDRDGQYNLAEFYEDAIGVERDIEQVKFLVLHAQTALLQEPAERCGTDALAKAGHDAAGDKNILHPVCLQLPISAKTKYGRYCTAAHAKRQE